MSANEIKVAADVAEIKTGMKYLTNTLDKYVERDQKEKDEFRQDIDSLKKSRTYFTGAFAVASAIFVWFISWFKG